MLRNVVSLLLLVIGLLPASFAAPPDGKGGGKGGGGEDPPTTEDPPLAPTDYVYVEFSLGGPSRRGTAYGLNERGEVVGAASFSEGVEHAFVYTDRYSATQSFETLDVNQLVADYIGSDTGWELEDGGSINESGWITGTGSFNGIPYISYCFTPPQFDSEGKVVVDARIFPLSLSGIQGFSWSITDNGDAVSDTFIDTPGNGRGGAIHKNVGEDSASEELLIGVSGSVPVYSMNNSRQIVGALGPFNQRRAYLYDGNSHALTELPLLGPAEGDCVADSEAFDINAVGVVVGASTTASIPINKKRYQCGPKHAFAWSAANGILDLGTLGGTESIARAISDAGDIVGYSDDAYGGSLVFFVPSGESQMYNVSGAVTNYPAELDVMIPNDTNNAGVIIGVGADAETGDRAPFMLVPVLQ